MWKTRRVFGVSVPAENDLRRKISENSIDSIDDSVHGDGSRGRRSLRPQHRGLRRPPHGIDVSTQQDRLAANGAMLR